MKKVVYIAFCFLFWCCNNSNTSELKISDKEQRTTEWQKEKLPKILFENLVHDLGDIVEGTQITDTFHFKNIGESSLIISDIETSCGCTTSAFPKEPVLSGESGEIAVSFDSTHKNGEATVSVIVVANTYPINTVLTIKANVVRNKH